MGELADVTRGITQGWRFGVKLGQARTERGGMA